jgi:hypothetical protein
LNRILAVILAVTLAAPAMVFAAPVAVASPPTQPNAPAADSQKAPSQAQGTPTPSDPAVPATEEKKPDGTVTADAVPTQPVVASGTPVVARTPEEAAKQTGFALSVDLDHYLGMGTFVNAEYYSYFAGGVTIGARFNFNIKSVRLAASARGQLNWEYSQPDTENARRIAPFDTRLGLSAPVLFREKLTGIAFTPSVGLTVPTSPTSWQAGLITAVSLGLGAFRSFGRFDLFANGAFAKNFQTSTINGVRSSNRTDAQGNLLCISRPADAYCAVVGNNTNFSVSISGGVNFHVTDEFWIVGSYQFLKAWRYSLPIDEFTPKTIDSNGATVADAVGVADRYTAYIGMQYQLDAHYSLALGLFTLAIPKTEDNKAFRFPLWPNNQADNVTSVNFTMSAAF